MSASSSMRHSYERDAAPQGSTSSLPRRVRAEERKYQSEMMFIGQRCHWHECHREDFLPFKCADCQQTYCSQHFRTAQHACPTATPTFVVPLCPLCHQPPKDWKRDEDPNVAMNAHLSPDPTTGLTECTAIDANGAIRATNSDRRTKRENECGERRCRKLMVVPIKCPACSMCFCPSHRAPAQHQCQSVTLPSARKLNAGQRPTTKKVQPDHQQKGSPITVPNIGKAISAANSSRKVDNRTRMERASAIKAMQARHQKGLLTQNEQVRLAEEIAAMKLHDDKKKDCCIC